MSLLPRLQSGALLGALTPSDISLLRCPETGLPLRFDGTLREGRALSGQLTAGAVQWPVEDGLPVLYRESQVQGTDRLLRHIYDGLPRLHDPVVKTTLPLFQTGGTEEQLRSFYLDRLALQDLVPPPDRPLRILEVSVGGGANLDRVLARLPRGVDVELWGLDLSRGMLRECRRRLRRQKRRDGRDGPVRLLLGDAHHLPFGDGVFDRVFHVGGIGGFNDPARALSELARVAVPGSPLVVVDERLDPSRRHNLFHKATFRAVTFYESDPHAPVEHLPPGAVDVRDEQPSRFFYCLSFRMPQGAAVGATGAR